MAKDEQGYIVVETIGCFLLLVLLMASILSLINIVTVQARVHYALTQAAETISMYCYPLELTGTADHIVNSQKKADQVQTQSDEFKTNVNELVEAVQSIDVDQIGTKGSELQDQLSGWADDITSDPEEVFQDLLNYALGQGKNAAFGELARSLVGRYLANGTQSGDEYLRSAQVIGGLKGLEFYDFNLFDANSTGNNDSTFLTSDEDVKIVVEYDIDYSFGALAIPFAEPKLHVTQEVVTKAWLNGSGEGYHS